MKRAVFLFCLLTAGVARAVIVSGGDGTGNTTGIGASSGWDYVGRINGGAAGVYLGDYGGSYWVLTAGHVGAGSFSLNEVTYEYVPGTAVTLTNTDGTPTDLTLFRIDGSPVLTTLTLASTTPRRNSVVTMIGNGIGRDAAPTIAIGGSAYTGYYWNSSSVKRWGTNSVIEPTDITYEGSNISTSGFYTTFTVLSGSAQATAGDSGGGVFTSSGVLTGIMLAVGTLTGQPDNSSVYGEGTYIASIAAYRSEILGIVSPSPVPEPGMATLMLMGCAALAFRSRLPH